MNVDDDDISDNLPISSSNPETIAVCSVSSCSNFDSPGASSSGNFRLELSIHRLGTKCFTSSSVSLIFSTFETELDRKKADFVDMGYGGPTIYHVGATDSNPTIPQ